MSSGAKRLVVFYDANCFANMPYEELREVVRQAENKILSTTLDELVVVPQKFRSDSRFELVFRKSGKLKGYFQKICLNAVNKNPLTGFDNISTIYLKENPIVCSAYYTWLPSALNPATITDIYRHVFNNLLFQLRVEGNVQSDWYRMEQQHRKREADIEKKISGLLDHKGGLEPSWILESRSKRIREAKRGDFKLADYQLVVGAFLHACARGCSEFVLTCDRDLLDIHENLMRSIIEHYTIYSLLSLRIGRLNDRDRLAYYSKGIRLFLLRDEIVRELENVVYKIRNSSPVINFGIIYYKPDVSKVFRSINLVPIWLRDFALEYKANLDCFSLDPKTEMKYPMKFFMNPTKSPGYVYFFVFSRTQVFYPGFLPECEHRCKYALAEKHAPSELTDFLKDPDIPNGPILL